MTHYPFWPFTIAVALCILAWVSGRLKRNAQPLRLLLADKGEAVLACEDTSTTGTRLARLYLNSAFSFRGHLLLAHLVIPVFAGICAFEEIFGAKKKLVVRKESNAEVQALIEEMTDLHMRITAANHPFLLASTIATGLFYFLIAYSLIVVIRGVIPARIPAEEIAERVDYAYARIPIKLRKGSYAHLCA